MRDIEKASAELRAQMERRGRVQQKLKVPIEVFCQRYRNWCLKECINECLHDFCLVRLVRNGAASLFLDYAETLESIEAKQKLVIALAKRINWKDALTVEELKMCQQFLDFLTIRIPHSNGQSITTRRISSYELDLQRRLSSHRPLDKSAASKLFRSKVKDTASGRLGKMIMDRDSLILFEAKLKNWHVVSALDVGGRASLRYCQTVYAQAGRRAGTEISKGISVLSWMGISAVTMWSFQFPEEIPRTAQSVVQFCEHFLKTAPALLADLELPAFN
ncbi:MAG: hypothetical protein ACRD51_05830 [Candidatus Acidiferrum sp.]